MRSSSTTRRRRRTTRLAAALSALGVLLAGCTSDGPQPRPTPTLPPQHPAKPNIVFVLTDDLTTDLIRYMPHVQALAEAGASFSRYFVVDSLCCPSRASIFTGEYPHNDHVFTNSGTDGGYATYNRYGDAAKSFVLPLAAAGYRTGFMGKYLNGYIPSYPPARGWDVWDVSGAAYREYGYDLNSNGAIEHHGHKPSDYLTNVLSDKASAFIRGSAHRGSPFALEVATYAPHRPFTPAPRDAGTFPSLTAPRGPAFNTAPAHAPKWLARFPKLSAREIRHIDSVYRLRVEAVQAVDRMIGRLQAVLAHEHQLQNTYFVFSSDNGYHLGQYQLLAGKQTAFDTDIRVPLIVSGPGIAAGRRIGALTSSVDLAPTFLAMAHTRPRNAPDGASLLPLLRGDPAGAAATGAVLIEHHGPVLASTDPDAQPKRSGNPPSYEAIRLADALYVEYETGDREYYDLRRDPNELDNIVGTLPRQRLASLHKLLASLESCRGAEACQTDARAG